MANALKGEISVTIAGAAFTLALDINQLIEVEEEVGLDLTEIVGGLRSVSLKVDRALLWAGLQVHHAPCNLLRAGELFGLMVREIGLQEAHAVILKLVASAMPEVEKTGSKARPRKAAGEVGTGNGS